MDLGAGSGVNGGEVVSAWVRLNPRIGFLSMSTDDATIQTDLLELISQAFHVIPLHRCHAYLLLCI